MSNPAVSVLPTCRDARAKESSAPSMLVANLPVLAVAEPPQVEAQARAPIEQILGTAIYSSFSRAFSAAFFDRNACDLRSGQARTSERHLQEEMTAYLRQSGGIPRTFSEKDFTLFASRALRRIHNELGIKAADVREIPALAASLKDALEVHYRLLLLAGMPESMAGRRGHMFSAAFVQELHHEAARVFKGEALKRVRKTAVNQVLMGRYDSLDAARKRYRALLTEARGIAANDPHLEPLARTAATLVFCGNFKTMAAFKTLYKGNYVLCVQSFGSDPDTASVIRSAALLLTMRKGETPSEAKLRLDALTKERDLRYPKAHGKSELLRTARLMVFLKKYPSFESFDSRYERVKKSVSRALVAWPHLQPLEATIINEVMAFKYASGLRAVKALAKLDAVAQTRFADNQSLAPLAHKGAVAVFRKEVHDLNHWERVQCQKPKRAKRTSTSTIVRHESDSVASRAAPHRSKTQTSQP